MDFTSFNLNDLGNDRVEVNGVTGYEATDSYKVSVSYFAGYKSSGQLTISGPDAIEKAENRARFKETMDNADIPTAKGGFAHSYDEAIKCASKKFCDNRGFSSRFTRSPVIWRTCYS